MLFVTNKRYNYRYKWSLLDQFFNASQLKGIKAKNMAEFENAGIRLKTARMAAGFQSAREFCDKYEISPSTYSLHETGGRNLKPKIAEKYAALLGVNATWLFTGSGTPYTNGTSVEEKPLSNNEFLELLHYQGNEKIKKTHAGKSDLLYEVNPLLFCKVIIKIMEALHELNVDLDIYQISKKATEIYQDILQTSKNSDTQLTMVELSITTFKRQIQEILEQKNKKLANE